MYARGEEGKEATLGLRVSTVTVGLVYLVGMEGHRLRVAMGQPHTGLANWAWVEWATQMEVQEAVAITAVQEDTLRAVVEDPATPRVLKQFT